MILQRFRVEKILGHGGMGEVLLAQDTLLNRRVALKRLRPTGDEREARHAAILKEARRASAISDRRIAAIYDVLSDGDDVLIVMEYVRGSTLRERMTGPVAVEEFWSIALPCAEAVGAAHAHGLVHRDIKPENLMITAEGEIKILDFGIAKRVEFPDTAAGSVTTTTTTEARSVTIAGTPHYMAPEAHYGGRLDRPTDVFSLGVVFYELLTGRRPFEGATYGAVLEQIMNTVPPPVTDRNPAAGAELEAVVAKMLSKDPAQRFATCPALIAALVAAREAGESAARTGLVAAEARAPRARSRWMVPLLGLSLVVAAAVVWTLWTGASSTALPGDLNLAVLPPRTPNATEDFANYALGATELLSARLQKHQIRPGFQLASFQEGFEERLGGAADARKVLGVNLALVPALEQKTDRLSARLELWDANRGRILRSRTFETSASQPFEFLDRIYRESVAMLGLRPDGRDASSESGVRGAGTLRFLLQGIGRRRSAETADAIRRAVEDLELACRTEPEAGAPRAWLAATHYRTNLLAPDSATLARAEATAREGIALDSTRAEAHRFLGNILASAKKWSESLEALARARALSPADDEACLRLARTYGRLGRADEEEATYLAVVESRPHCWAPWWWLAHYHFRAGHVDQAIQAFREMIRRSPDLSKGYSSLGGLLVLGGEYAAAIDTLKRSIELRPTKVACDNLGSAYFNSGRLNESIAAYNQSFQFGFADYASWINLGDAYYWLRDRPDQARDAYQQGIRLAHEEASNRARKGGSSDFMIPAHLATVFPKLGEPDSARVYLRRALAADSTNSMVQFCAALTTWQLADRPGAIAWLRRAIEGGYPTAELRDSPVFQEWRSEDAFRALVPAADSTHHPVAMAAEGGHR